MISKQIERLVDLALEEDIGPGDITTDNLVPADQKGRGQILARQPLTVAGLHVARYVFQRLDPDAKFITHCTDGDLVEPDTVMAEVIGRMRALLTAERTALNFLQRLCGIATHVRTYCGPLQGRPVKLVDTRKTTPGWRILEKYAVRVGGARNHRSGLFDGVLIKDNHIAACGGIAEAVTRIRSRASHLVRIEVEAATMAEVSEAIAAGADVIMLDNMSVEQITEAVAVIGDHALVEVSGGITRDRLVRLADTGVHFISVGGLTHAATSVDISMDIEVA
ncbi:Quinolinate phosphoribosyltransferase [decarboxylating] (EC [Olavius algarvensis associated proteobacterium Delta 3]|nr:Quinolinate phosphoribosyltransferase [decarboxylating] (EC [Olavius algarvensis associated proteobacterium Delta 3]CAB5163205.1 Quinolinate phosphoribosyltransferase [decarboxylating] (EC [Olavius algarvensis associated proteobacterium Delta 3]